jgi:hypothetical protein
VGFRVKSNLRNHQAIVQPRLYDSAVVTQITLKPLHHSSPRANLKLAAGRGDSGTPNGPRNGTWRQLHWQQGQRSLKDGARGRSLRFESANESRYLEYVDTSAAYGNRVRAKYYSASAVFILKGSFVRVRAQF